MTKKKFTKKQLAAQALFAKRAKAGAFRKKGKKSKSLHEIVQNAKRGSRNRSHSSGGSFGNTLEKALKDKSVKEIIIRK